MDITIKDVEHRYQMKTPFERLALYDINASIKEGSYVAVIGHTGSGKSTLLQHLNGLLKPTKGQISLGSTVIQAGKKNKELKTLRKKVGIVFQFPEHQLFEETVLKDISFGPMNFGVKKEDAEQKAREMLKLVGLSEELLDRSPFELSGGQMRRVAIAGVLAMDPEVLVLDEPTAGLDPRGRKEIMDMFYELHQRGNLTTILVTHSMEDAAAYADEMIVMHKGTIQASGSPHDLFLKGEEMAGWGLDLPETIKFQRQLEAALGVRFKEPMLTIEDAAAEIRALFQGEDLMMDSMIIGKYVPGSSLVHRLDPRTKLITIFLFVCIVFLANNVQTYALLGLFTVGVVSLTRVPFSFLMKGLKPIIWIVIFTFLLHILMTHEGPVIFQLGVFKVYEGGLVQGIFISLRFVYLILMTTLLTLTTTPIEITDGMEQLLNPLKKIKLPVHELALMMSISLRFIPTLMEETDRIMKAQMARGVDFTSGPVKDRVKAIVPLLVPLFVSAFKRAEELAVAMEARGYQGGEGRTKYRKLVWTGKDTSVIVSLMILAALLFFLRT